MENKQCTKCKQVRDIKHFGKRPLKNSMGYRSQCKYCESTTATESYHRRKKVSSEGQITTIRIIWELAQGRIDKLYSKQGAEEEKQAIEQLISEQFPLISDRIIRSEDLHYKG